MKCMKNLLKSCVPSDGATLCPEAALVLNKHSKQFTNKQINRKLNKTNACFKKYAQDGSNYNKYICS